MKNLHFVLPVAIVVTLISIAFLSKHRSQGEFYRDSCLIMDTVVDVNLWGKGDLDARSAIDSAFVSIAKIDSLFKEGMVRVSWSGREHHPIPTREVLRLADSLYRLTLGAFDPTIGSVSRLWDFSDGSQPPQPDSLKAGLRMVGLEKMKNVPGKDFILDVGGIAKGYAIDVAAEVLRNRGFESAIVNGGGDMRLLGKRPDGKPWRIAIRDPRHPGNLIGYIDVEDCAVATSGDYERFFFYEGGRYHHILDPKTGMPAVQCQSVTVVAPTACIADGLATGLFVLGPRKGFDVAKSLENVEAIFIYADGDSIRLTPGIQNRFGELASN